MRKRNGGQHSFGNNPFGCAAGETAETENRESNINEVTIDPNVVAAILSNGPEGAAAVPSPHPGECICVPYYQCHNGQIITDGAGIIDIRLKPKKTNGNKDPTPHPRVLEPSP